MFRSDIVSLSSGKREGLRSSGPLTYC